MINNIKQKLLEQPDKLVDLLEVFGFSHIKLNSNEIRFARDESAGRNISIRLQNNEYLNVNDYARSIHADIFSYIIQEKKATFKEVLQQTKQILGLDDYCEIKRTTSLFGGIYNRIHKQSECDLKIYDEEVLKQYRRCGNLRFLKDGISLESQTFWNLHFDVESNRIMIPIYNEFHQLVGCKGRLNGDADEYNPKYIYTIPVSSSQVLYGYSHNYQYLYGNDVIITEAEKSVMQAFSFGVRNMVALGSNNLSEKHAKLLLQLSPKRIVIALDEGLKFEQTKKNVDMIKTFLRMRETEIWYWDSTQDIDIPIKASPTDMGKEKYTEIINEQLVRLY